MPIDIQDVFDVLSLLCDESNLRVTVKESAKSGLIAGASTFVGAIVGGPVGVAVGGGIGVAAATYLAQGKFKPVSQVLSEMSKQQKELLYEKALTIVRGLSIEDAAVFAQMAVGNSQLNTELIGLVVDHVSNQLHLKIID